MHIASIEVALEVMPLRCSWAIVSIAPMLQVRARGLLATLQNCFRCSQQKMTCGQSTCRSVHSVARSCCLANRVKAYAGPKVGLPALPAGCVVTGGEDGSLFAAHFDAAAPLQGVAGTVRMGEQAAGAAVKALASARVAGMPGWNFEF